MANSYAQAGYHGHRNVREVPLLIWSMINLSPNLAFDLPILGCAKFYDTCEIDLQYVKEAQPPLVHHGLSDTRRNFFFGEAALFQGSGLRTQRT